MHFRENDVIINELNFHFFCKIQSKINSNLNNYFFSSKFIYLFIFVHEFKIEICGRIFKTKFIHLIFFFFFFILLICLFIVVSLRGIVRLESKILLYYDIILRAIT